MTISSCVERASPTGRAFRAAAVLMASGAVFAPALGTWAGLALMALGLGVGLAAFVRAVWRLLTA